MTFVTSGLEHLGVAALSAYLREHGHETALVYEPMPFSSNSGPDSELLSRLLEPAPTQTAQRVLDTRPDVVAFSSYSITHQWSVQVARAIKLERDVPIVFGGPHVTGAPAHAIRETSIDAVVEAEGEGALLDLVESVETRRGVSRFGRSDVPNVWMRRDGRIVQNPLRPQIEDLDALPWADKSIFYDAVPAFEREFYVVSRRGCPYRCSFCEYSIFPRQYPGEKPVRRRSVEHVIGELEHWKARGRMRKVFFWDAIFTLDVKWIEAFADAYASRIGLPFECYTHPHAMSREMATHLARAGCKMVRVGVQTVNSDTLSGMDRKGDRDRVAQTLDHLRELAIPYALDHMLGLPGEGADDQREAIRFYNQVRPSRMHVHWMTYLPGTTAIEEAREKGILSSEKVEKILSGEKFEGYEVPRLVGPGAHKAELDEIQRLAVLFDLLPTLPRPVISWLLESGWYRRLPRGLAIRQAAAILMAFAADEATRERTRTIFSSALGGMRRPSLRRLLHGDPPIPPPAATSAAAAPTAATEACEPETLLHASTLVRRAPPPKVADRVN